MQMKLTKSDKLILESYKTMIEGLAKYLPNSYELVLHSLENLEESVIAIYNGEHTGRKVGAPITDLALNLLEQIKNGNEDSIVYFSKNSRGEPLKSTTIAIRGDDKRIIGLVCINMYLNTPFKDILDSYVPQQLNSFTETYKQSSDDLIKETYEMVKTDVLADDSILPSNKNKIIIERLYDKGIFQMKDAVYKIETLMNISKNTVYLHIRNHKKNIDK